MKVKELAVREKVVDKQVLQSLKCHDVLALALARRHFEQDVQNRHALHRRLLHHQQHRRLRTKREHSHKIVISPAVASSNAKMQQGNDGRVDGGDDDDDDDSAVELVEISFVES